MIGFFGPRTGLFRVFALEVLYCWDYVVTGEPSVPAPELTLAQFEWYEAPKLVDLTEAQTRPLVTFREAAAAGATRFFTGLPCPRGHIAERLVSNRHCIMCNSERNSTPENKEKRRIRSRRNYASASPEAIEARRARQLLKRSKKPRSPLSETQRAHANLKKKEWREQNPERVRIHQRNRRAKILASGGMHTPDDISHIYDQQCGKCAQPWCRKKLKTTWHVDHIIPLFLGGSNARQNLQLLCAPCNRSKGKKHPIEHAQRQGYLL